VNVIVSLLSYIVKGADFQFFSRAIPECFEGLEFLTLLSSGLPRGNATDFWITASLYEPHHI
jgi:hypothetical protein